MSFLLPLVLAMAPQFDVASIKATAPSIPRPGRLQTIIVITSSGRLTAKNATLKDLIKGAYGLEDYQVSGGPQWIASARFDVEAMTASGANRDLLLKMLQTLLGERFRLSVHHETKDVAVYALVVAKGGPKFHALKAEKAACWPACEGSPGKMNHLRQSDLPSLARYLTRLSSDLPVIDKTGLTGRFGLDLDMEKIMEAAQNGGPPTNAAIYDATVNAMQDELGLKLTPAKASAEMLVIDRAEKPSEN